MLSVRWCVVSTRLWINTAYGVDKWAWLIGQCPNESHGLRKWKWLIEFHMHRDTIYIGGLSMVKNKYLCLKTVFIHGRMHV